jgi:glucose-6-phosphate isomerase
MTIRIDYSNMIGSAVGGIEEKVWADSSASFREAHRAFSALRKGGTVAFADIVTDTRLRQQALDYASTARGKYTDVVILGIGGSALGPIALRTALRPSGWNLLDEKRRDGHPRLHVLDNVDPDTIAALVERLDLPRALFIVTSKSGGTAETMAQFLVIHDRINAAGLEVAKHFVFVTDPEQGALRPLAKSLAVPALEIPSAVGGRFSVLTPVGTLPAALIGIDVSRLLEGAAAMVDRCETDELSQNPAGTYATLQWLAETRYGKSINVLMPYSDQLRDIADWFVQLWAESLGKERSDGAFVGQTPVAALGATDQHSQVQLFMEGPKDKIVTFIAIEKRSRDVTIPHGFADVKELGYLGGHSLGELIDIEQRATAGALAKRGRPNVTIHLEAVDEWHVGGFMMLMELATAYAGQLYGIDAFNQPGVELGKQFAYALLGRPGADAARKEWESLPQADSRWSV